MKGCGFPTSAGALEPPHTPLLAAWADFEAAAGDADAAAELRQRCQALQPGVGAGRKIRHPAVGKGDKQASKRTKPSGKASGNLK